jgi:hypothetical protein
MSYMTALVNITMAYVGQYQYMASITVLAGTSPKPETPSLTSKYHKMG